MTALLHTPICELLGCRQPIALAGMGGVARSELVAAVTEAGGFGFLGMVREPVDLIRAEIAAVRAAGHQRFGVNLIPAATPAALLEAELAVCIELKVPAICLFWDIDPMIVRRLRDSGIVVVYQVGSVAEGVAAQRAGAQVVIAQGVEAGGHVRGTRQLHEFLPELADALDVPVLAAGGIVDGEDLVAAMALGAQGVVLGTAMIPTRESFAHDFHKERLLDSSGSDTVLTEAFHVNWPAHAPVRVLRSDVTSGLRGDPQSSDRVVIGWEEGRPIYLFSTDSPLRSMTGDFGAMALYAGMGVGRVRKMQGAGEKLRAIVRDAERLLTVATAEGPARGSSPICYAEDADPEYMGYLGQVALAEKLVKLQAAARAAFGSARQRPDLPTATRRPIDYARWTVILGRLMDEAGGGRAEVLSVPPDLAVAEAALLQQARSLVPQVADERVRGALTALIAAFGGAAPVEPVLQLWGAGRVLS